MQEAGLTNAEKVESWGEVLALDPHQTAFIRLEFDSGFETSDYCFLSEQDILGDRLVRRRRSRKSEGDILKEASSLIVG